jgi:hypothetical protein
MSYILQNTPPKRYPEDLVRKYADEAGFGAEILVLDLMAGCGVTSPVNGKLWRVFDPASGRAFVFCSASQISLDDVAALGLEPSTPFICYEIALDEETQAFIKEQGILMFIE